MSIAPNEEEHSVHAVMLAEDARPALLSLATMAGRDVHTITSILLFLDVHPALMDLPRILQGLLYAMDAMELSPKINIGDADLRVWRDECLWIIANMDNPTFIAALGPQFYKEEGLNKRNPVIHKGVRDHAFPYATLWHEPADSEGKEDYYRLVGHLLSVYAQRGVARDLVGQRYLAYLDLRALCSLQNLTIPAELNISDSEPGFLRCCLEFNAGKSIYPLASRFSSISRLVRYLNGDKPPERLGNYGHHKRGVSNGAGLGVLMSQGVSEFPLEDPDDPDLLPGYVSFVRPEESCPDLDEALPSNEVTAKSEICLIDTGLEVRPFVAELLSHQGIRNHIARERQFLPFGYNRLTLSELANILFGVTDEFLLCRERLRSTPKDEQSPLRLRLEALLAMHLMLWFGRTLEDCKKLRIVERNTRPATLLELIPSDGVGLAEFRFFAPSPDYLAEEQLPQDAVRLTQQTISVPDLVGASVLVMALAKGAPVADCAVFSCKVDALEREIRVLLAELGRGDPRYTMVKLRSYLHLQIITDSHDVVAATMLSGMPCLSANTPLYYSQYNVNYLRSLYCSSLHRVLKEVYACAGLEAPNPEVSAVADAAVGARNCLRLSTVRTNLQMLLLVLRKRPRNDLQKLVHWHNCLTLWTALMFLMATGCRSIRNPLKQAAEFESRFGHGAIGDKGADDGHMSRLVALPDLLRRQLQAYEAHCAAIMKHLSLPASGQNLPNNGFFIQMSDLGQPLYEAVRPRTISAMMRQTEGYIPHPVNAFRKLVRTELAERGCPPETLASFMGHWLQGEEPQDIFSSFCPRTYILNLHSYLLPLMEELGWMVRNSHLVTEAGA